MLGLFIEVSSPILQKSSEKEPPTKGFCFYIHFIKNKLKYTQFNTFHQTCVMKLFRNHLFKNRVRNSKVSYASLLVYLKYISVRNILFTIEVQVLQNY